MKKSVLEPKYDLEKDPAAKSMFLTKIVHLSPDIEDANLEQSFLTLYNKKGLAIARYRLTDFKCKLVTVNQEYLHSFKENNSNREFADMLKMDHFLSTRVEEFYIKFMNRNYPDFKKDYLNFTKRYALLQLSDIEEKDLNPLI